ncbi:protein translocase subunit SecD [Gordonibacter massiliensis (ex Traore et al. 2017)]|uniref:Multifunctional fusion protein n=1 Tax=Gordonibacter massiliensis (ex Traore et al. 2017) TaxID=1841863 RepID=A0A842JBD6_9ACTN|nr:protein translocase subunit SecD [Gordonibacter massiliensis (ex Traore et al. 2017)]MBC2889037.1 protein translocase subunit SecD [Gordonibacter massiliensis (ex Traore et al. 2017)]
MATAQKPKKKPGRTTDRRNVWLLIVTTLLVVGSIFMFAPPQEKINQGLDIQGGLSVVLTAKGADGAAVSADDMEKSRAIIESRVNALGASEAVVQVQGNDQILVQIPGLTNTEDALNTIGKTGKLEFARLDSFTDSDVKTKIENGQFGNEATVTDELGNSLPSGKTEHLKVESGTYTPLVTGSNITNVSVGQASQTSTDYAVNVKLDGAGTTAFAEATKELAPTKGKIVIILDGEVQSAPAVQSEIPNGDVSITGNYSLDEAKSLQTVLESGSLPVSFEYAQSQVVGPTLGQDALASGVLVALIGLAVVMLYLLFFYRGLGLITAAAMAIFAVLYLGILATLSAFGLFSLSLAGIAGVVLTIGMAADSSILTMERFREEIRMGRSVRAASITGVRHAIVTSVDADLVTLVSALSLFFLASASVKGFGLTLALGIVCDIVMMLLFKAPLIRLLAPKVIAKHPGFWGVKDAEAAAKDYEALALAEGTSTAAAEAGEAMDAAASERLAEKRSGAAGEEAAQAARKPRGRFIKHDINFLGYRRIFLAVAAVLVCASFAVVGFKGLNFGIEFVGGTSISFHGTGDVTTEQLRTAFDQAGEPDAVIQTTNADGQEGFLVRTTTTSAEDATARANQVADGLGLSTDSFEVTTIGPDWGASVIQSSLIAFLVSIVLIIIYIAIRFDYKMGITAIVALLHDLILVMGIYALVGREVNPNTIAALLTILGYSLYDTVVVFHRINDNMQGDDIKCTFMTMANHSINQVLVRTINTTLTSLIPVLAMLFFGGETLKDFAFAMAIGLVCGSYSSVAVATPLYAMWKTREPRYAKLQKKYGTQVGRFEFANPNAMAVAAAKAGAPKAGGTQVDATTPSPVATAGHATADDKPHGASASKATSKPPKAKRKKRPDKK